MQIGSAIVTSRLLYGIGITSRGRNNWQTLAPTYNRMVRYSSGAFVTSPIQAIMIEAGVLPFNLVVLQSLVRLSIRLLELDCTYRDLPLINRTAELLRSITGEELPTVSLQLRRKAREWNKQGPQIVWDIKNKLKAGDPPEKVRPIVQEILQSRFQQAVVVYTDGSKSHRTVGAGVFGPSLAISVALPQQCSVFSAEAYAIKAALTAFNSNCTRVILTDSASCLSALESGKCKHPWIQQIELLALQQPTYFCWIPGHSGVHGNEEADRLARTAANSTPLTTAIPGDDAIRAMKVVIRELWDSTWRAVRDVKLREVKFETSKWIDHENSADQRVLTRLRIGHTRLTHTFLLRRDPPPQCECCGTTMTVKHILIECRKYTAERMKYGLSETNLKSILKNDIDKENSVLMYLKDSKLYNEL